MSVTAGDTSVDVAPDPNGGPLAIVFKTIADPYVGHSRVQVLSERFALTTTTLQHTLGTTNACTGCSAAGQRARPALGDSRRRHAAVAKLSATATGDTLVRGQAVPVPPVIPPPPVLGSAILARTAADEDKLATRCNRLQEEDPRCVERNEETHRTILRGTGETHLQITLEKRPASSASCRHRNVRVAYRETQRQRHNVEGKHKAVRRSRAVRRVRLNVEPMPRGGGSSSSTRRGGAIARP